MKQMCHIKNLCGLTLSAVVAATVSVVSATDVVSADLESLVVPAGEEMTISQSATYDTVTVNGTLIVSDGELTATNAFRIADGVGATGTLVITNSGKILSSEGILAVGVNGGSGQVHIHTSGNSCRYIDLGDGGGASVIRYAGGGSQSRCMRKKGSGTCRLEFAGGSPAFTDPRFFYVYDGQLTLAGIDGADIVLRSSGAIENLKLIGDSAETGILTTEGAGAFSISLSAKEENAQNLPLDLTSHITWGHTGGFILKGYANKVFTVSSPDFFHVGGVPASLRMEGARLDLAGKHVGVKSLSGYAVITNGSDSVGAFVLGSDGADCTFYNGFEWSTNAALCKIGAGTLTYRGHDFSGRVILSNGVFRTTVDTTYAHYRFVIDDCIGANRTCMQLSEFRLLDGDEDVTSLRSGYTFGTGADDRSSSQGPEMALDGSLATKWLTMKTGAYDADELFKTNCWMQIDFDAPRAISGYDWATASDYPAPSSYSRDPMKWRFLGSDDGETWTLIDSRDIGYTILERSAWTGPYPAERAEEITFGSIEAAGGVFEVNGRIASSDIVQTGGGFFISETGTVRLVNGVWTMPSFTAGSSGIVVSDSSAANTVFCDSASLAGDLVVASGALEFTTPSCTSDRLFRFTIKKTYSDNACTQLSRLRLFDKDGNVLNEGLSAAKDGTAPASLAAGCCAYAASYSEGGSSAVENLFDGKTETKMCLTSLTMGGDPEDNTWRIVHFRLAADVTVPVVSYQLTTANDETPRRNPTVWTLESSSDGENWTLLDSRVSGEFVNPTTIYTDFNDGVPMKLRSAPYIPVELVTLADGASLSVAADSFLGPSGTTFSADRLSIDCSAGAGTISALAPRANGLLELTNVPDGADLAGYVLPVTIQSLSDPSNLKTWTVSVNGVSKGNLRIAFSGGNLSLAHIGMQILFR